MLARTAYGTPLGENSYGMPGQPKQRTPNTRSVQQPFQSQGGGLDMSAYSPGRAQPIQPPSQGTPFQAYSPPAPAQQPAFTQSAVGVGGQVFADPSQAFAQRDALIQRINEARAPTFANSGVYASPQPPPAPLDFNALLAQANNAVASGWQNPLAPQNFGAPQYQIGVPGGMLPQPTPLAEPAMPPMHNGLPVVYQNGVAGTVDLGSAGRFPGMTGTLGGPGFRPLPQQPPAPPQMVGIRHWSDNPAYQQPKVPAGWEGIKGSDTYASNLPLGSDDWWRQQNARAQAAQAAERPVATPSRQPAQPARQPTPPSNPRAAADAVRASGGSRDAGNAAWREAHTANTASRGNQQWLASQSPANRRNYQMMQRF